jgi:WD40 repeat protein
MRNDDPDRDKTQSQEGDEAPAIFSLGHLDGKPTFNRRTFLEIAAVAAGATALPSRRALAQGKRSSAARAHKEAVTALAVNPAGNLLASGDKAGTIRLWKLPEGVLLRSWSGQSSEVSGLYFLRGEDAQSAPIEVLWSVSSTGPLRRWSLPDADRIKEGRGKGNRNLTDVVAAPNAGNWYAVRTSGSALDIRSPATGATIVSLDFSDERVKSIAATSDGRLLIAGGAEGRLGLWTMLASGTTPGSGTTPASGTTPDGGTTPDSHPPVASETKPDGSIWQTLKTGSSPVSALAVDPNGTLALSAHEDAHLRTWTLPELAAGRTFQSSLGKPLSVALRPQLDLFVVGSQKPAIGLWRLDKPKSSPRMLKGHTAPVRTTVITPDGSLLISGSYDKTIRLWSLPDGKYLRNLVDLEVNFNNVKGTTYHGTDAYGRTINYTLPCGSPIPPGAVCVCNCVPGSMSIPHHHTSRYDSSGYCTCDLICTCNTVCTCQSVGGGGYSISYWYPN